MFILFLFLLQTFLDLHSTNMDLFSLLRNNLPPSKKMINAITSKDASLIEDILRSGFNVNSRVYEQGGETALHIAVSKDNYSKPVIEKLIEYKADPSVTNDFGVTSLHRAATNDDADIAFLLQHDKSSTSINDFWVSFTRDFTHWLQHHTVSPKTLMILLIATPNFAKYPENIRKTMFTTVLNKQTPFYNCLKVMAVIDKTLRNQQIAQIPDDDERKEFLEWLDNFKRKVPTLQHCSRMALRQALDNKWNVIYGTERLYLPKSLKQFVKFNDITSVGLSI